MVEGNLSAENILVLCRGEQYRIYGEERTAVCPAMRQEAESLFVTHRHMIEHAGRKLCALVAGAFIEGIIDDEAILPLLRSQRFQKLLAAPHGQPCREGQPIHMGIGEEAILRVLGKASPQFLHALLHVEAGRAEGIAEDVGEKELDGNAFRLDAATGTKYVDDLKI